MSFASLAQAVAGTEFFTGIRESGLTYPVVMSLHLSCIAIFGGMILLTDLRLLGAGMRSVTVTDMVKQLRPWKWLGFIIMISCGIMLGGAKFDTYYDNPYFQIKMLLLLLVGVHAWVFRRSVYHNTAALDKMTVMPRNAKLAASLSMVLWVGILSAGRWIAYYERPTQAATTFVREALRILRSI